MARIYRTIESLKSLKSELEDKGISGVVYREKKKKGEINNLSC